MSFFALKRTRQRMADIVAGVAAVGKLGAQSTAPQVTVEPANVPSAPEPQKPKRGRELRGP